MADILQPTADNIRLVVDSLRAGEVLGLPTETVYGLAANALDVSACSSIFEIKGRPLIDPLIVHVDGLAAAGSLAVWNDQARVLAEHFWPGPLTIVLPKLPLVPDLVTAGLPSVALRSPAHPVMRAVLEESGLPLAAPSANRFAALSPTTAQHVEEGLGNRLEYILDGGPCSVGVESTIVDLRCSGQARILRPGAIEAYELEQALGRPVLYGAAIKSSSEERQVAPGNLDKHYCPRTPLYFLQNHCDIAQPDDGNIAVVYFKRPLPALNLRQHQHPRPAHIYWLSEDGDLATAARCLYALLHRLDALNYTAIWIELAPDWGIGKAINDRLKRAATC